MVKQVSEPTRFNDLLRLMDGLCALHVELERIIVAKLEAMRRADTAGMQTVVEREQVLTARLGEREGLRKQLMDAIGVELGLPRGEGRRMTVSRLAARLPESSRPALWQRADALRRAIAGAAQANRVAAVAARTLIHHMQWVIAAVRPACDAPITYSKRGQMVPSGGTMLLETVG